MKKIILVVAAVALVAVAGIAIFAIRRPSRTPSGNDQPDQGGGKPLAAVLPADSEYPAVGACVEPGDENVVRVEVNQDVPSPRCQKMTAKQRLVIKNKTSEPLSLWFGDKKEYVFSVAANGEYAISQPVGELLAPRVHVLHGSPYEGPAVWLLDVATPYLYRFSDYPAPDAYTGPRANVDFETSPAAAKIVGPRIIDGLTYGPNFAGHYTVIEWGCGASCQMHAIVDAKTGAIVEYSLGSAFSLQYRLDSRLLVANPPLYLDELSEAPAGVAVEYYEMKDGRLNLLARQARGEGSSMVCIQVITRAKSTLTGEEKDFPTPCAVPFGWEPMAAPTPGSGGILPYDSGVQGKVILGPNCPVQREPPDPACADKPYVTAVQVIAADSPSSAPFAIAETDQEGNFRVMLPPGEYGLQPVGGNPFPRCETQTIAIEPGALHEVRLSCDTGIR
ncbi:MAG: hypothetical protein G01um101431_1049 [Parcubacteria group bacterium Gr01-1014_31]|nr:MAG: hypothetical protein G01um101431_1049 [Parcubacteria group bacterium Gr01-1014_31]